MHQKPKPVTIENIPALLEWIKKHELSIDQVRQVYFMSADIEEAVKDGIIQQRKYKYNLPVDYDSLDWKQKREVREQYTDQQKGKCYYCKCNLSEQPPIKITNKKINWDLFPKNFLKYPIHLQHDHDTGFTEGAVHNYCNAVMWQYEGK